MIIRDAVPSDHAGWLTLWQGFLDFYQQPLPAATTAATWARLMDPASPLTMRLAATDTGTATDTSLLGFAIHRAHPSTWVPGDDGYLEDLFVAPTARGQGVARALLGDLIAIARAKGWHRLTWHTDASNTAACALYDQLATAEQGLRYRLTL